MFFFFLGGGEISFCYCLSISIRISKGTRAQWSSETRRRLRRIGECGFTSNWCSSSPETSTSLIRIAAFEILIDVWKRATTSIHVDTYCTVGNRGCPSFEQEAYIYFKWQCRVERTRENNQVGRTSVFKTIKSTIYSISNASKWRIVFFRFFTFVIRIFPNHFRYRQNYVTSSSRDVFHLYANNFDL